LKAHRATIDARIKAVEGRKDWLRRWLQLNMSRASIKSIKCPWFTITLKAGRQRVSVENEDVLPAPYWTTPKPVPSRAAISAALKAGEDVPGAAMETGPDYVEIRK